MGQGLELMKECPLECLSVRFKDQCFLTHSRMHDLNFNELFYAMLLLSRRDLDENNDTAISFLYFLIFMRTVVAGLVIYGLTRIFLLLVSEAGCIIQMIMHSLFSAGWELRMSICSFLAIFRDAIMEIWTHLTRENINLLMALGIIIYAMPEILDVLKDMMKKNAITVG